MLKIHIVQESLKLQTIFECVYLNVTNMDYKYDVYYEYLHEMNCVMYSYFVHIFHSHLYVLQNVDSMR